MRLLLWNENGQVHADGKEIVFADAKRLHFYDSFDSITYDSIKGKWHKNGVEFTPTLPYTFTMDDGRKVTASLTEGVLTWQVQ